MYYCIIVKNEVNRSWKLPEKKLSVKVGHIDGVHVNHMDKAEPRQCLKNNTTTSDNQ